MGWSNEKTAFTQTIFDPLKEAVVAAFFHVFQDEWEAIPLSLPTSVRPGGLFFLPEIVANSRHVHLSQPVFARYLNVSKNLVSDWGARREKTGWPGPAVADRSRKKWNSGYGRQSFSQKPNYFNGL
jgi:hypothetical protein